MRERLRALFVSDTLAAVVGYLLLILLATQPAVLCLRTAIIGDPYSDMWKHLWGLWWYQDALVNQHTIPLFTSAINYPQGGYLYFADPLTALASVPLQPFLGLVGAYNVLLLVQVLCGCMGAYFLARELGLEHSGAFLGGLIYGLSPYVLSYSVASGVTETVNLAWPPLYLIFLLRSLRGGGLRCQAAAAALLFITAFACWYYSEFLLLMTAFCVVFGDSEAAGRVSWRYRLKAILARAAQAMPILILSFCLILPFASTFAQVLQNPYNLVTPDKHGTPGEAPTQRDVSTIRDYLGENQLNYTGILDFLLPGKDNATTTHSMDRLTRVYYIGQITLSLIVLGFILTPRPWSMTLHFWLWTTVAFGILSLGPIIHLRSSVGAESTVCNSWLYSVVYHAFPIFKQIAQPFRLMLLVYMGVGILAGFALQRVQERVPGLRRLGWLFALGVLAETLYVSPTPYPMPMSPAQVHPIYHEIAAEAGNDAVIDLPGERPGSLLQPGEYYYYQTVHRHPIPYRTSGQVSPQVRGNNVHRTMARLLFQKWDTAEEMRLIGAGIEGLRDMRFRWIIVHRRVLGAWRTEALTQVISAAVGPPYLEDDDVIVYWLY